LADNRQDDVKNKGGYASFNNVASKDDPGFHQRGEGEVRWAVLDERKMFVLADTRQDDVEIKGTRKSQHCSLQRRPQLSSARERNGLAIRASTRGTFVLADTAKTT
jgi:hypothetical protein